MQAAGPLPQVRALFRFLVRTNAFRGVPLLSNSLAHHTVVPSRWGKLAIASATLQQRTDLRTAQKRRPSSAANTPTAQVTFKLADAGDQVITVVKESMDKIGKRNWLGD